MAETDASPSDLPWLHLQPAEGWARFTQHAALLDAIWAGLSDTGGDWHDMNPMQGLSIWEARDGSALLMAFADDVASTLCELSVQAGVARDYLQPIAQQFGLVQL